MVGYLCRNPAELKTSMLICAIPALDRKKVVINFQVTKPLPPYYLVDITYPITPKPLQPSNFVYAYGLPLAELPESCSAIQASDSTALQNKSYPKTTRGFGLSDTLVWRGLVMMQIVNFINAQTPTGTTWSILAREDDYNNQCTKLVLKQQTSQPKQQQLGFITGILTKMIELMELIPGYGYSSREVGKDIQPAGENSRK